MSCDPPSLPGSFRKGDIGTRRDFFVREYPELARFLEEGVKPEAVLRLADTMVENAVGAMSVPLGIAPGFLVNGVRLSIPLATEEPSVVAAASFGASLAAAGGGFTAVAPRALIESMVYLERVGEEGEKALGAIPLSRLVALHKESHPSLYARGGGLEKVSLLRLPDTGVVRFCLHIHVCDAMGANIANTAAELIAPLLEDVSGGKRVMAILSNAMPDRVGRASCLIPLRRLARSGYSGEEMGRRIALACRIAAEDPARALTHNKGIMNGVSALALATGNDTRGLEAAVHHHAAGQPLSRFQIAGDALRGELAMPVPLASVGGAVSVHPLARFSLGLLGNPDSAALAEAALALALAQNLAALAALTGEGIQQGHMRLHARRLS